MGYFVEDGKSLVCKKGILKPHDPVKPEFISAADAKAANAQLEALEKKGSLYKAEKSKAQEAAEKAEAEAKKKAKAAEAKKKDKAAEAK